ncbi:MAG TPA: Maf family protein [Treponemataceae bacterium]|nr:septum formation protein Maf [Treponema sp.]HOF84998.1 Maf family protein [Treponemataceae bacterium]HOS35254.1 Maf family protein [Treponemataceae bacterium]HPA10720.1 Maf family protein [Treponemataceae bacterium]HPL91048.1 Maf family protein [Treponemataceae bacterium]
MEPIILASTSQRRQEILRSLGIPFTVMVPTYEEPAVETGDPVEVTELNSMKKVESIIRMELDLSVPWVLGADTLISQNGRLFGKPSSRTDAEEMIRSFSGTTHSVVTSISLFDSKTNFITSKTSESTVSFIPLSDAEIEEYLDTAEWQGVAGSYRLQGRAAMFIDRIEGSWSGIVGLPIHSLYGILREHGYRFSV